jgi:uncharacterized protein (TIGR00266 family)
MQAEVKGTTAPILEVTLDPGDEVISTHGELSWMTANVVMSQTANTGGGKGLMAGLKRIAGGGGLFLTRYQASGGQGSVVFAAKMPGRIFPIEITSAGGYLVHRHGWLCGTSGITPTVGMQQSFRGGLWGGDGFVLEKLEGNGTAWVELAGEITQYDLVAGQTLLVHPGHIGVFQDSVSFTITRVPGITNKLFGGDGYHLVALTGPGTIWLQSMPLPILAGALEPFLGGGGSPGADAAVGGSLGGIIGGVLGRSV